MVVITACAQITQKKENICTRISVLFRVEENPFVVTRVLCKKCYRRIEKYEATLKELTTLKDCFSKNLLWWKEEGSKTETPSYGIQ